MPLLLGVFDTPDKLVEVVSRLRNHGYDDLDVFQPSPFPEVEDAIIDKPSRVRLWTLIGGLAGVTTGFVLWLWWRKAKTDPAEAAEQ